MFGFETVAETLWKSLMSRHAKTRKVGGLTVKVYAGPRCSLPEFREWLRQASHQGKGEVWICAYSGEPLAFRSDKAESCLSIDHYVPMERGGLTELANLRVCSKRMNNMKGSLSPEGWASLQALLESLGDVGRPNVGDAKDRAYIERQLCAQQTGIRYQRARHRAATAVGEKW